MKNVIFISIAERSSWETFPSGGCEANEHHDWQHHGWVDWRKTRETFITLITCSVFFLGNGLDIPLLGYREASREELGEVHELFDDECYGISQCFLLSTSQVTRTVIKVSFVITAQYDEFNKSLFCTECWLLHKSTQLFFYEQIFPCTIISNYCTGGTGLRLLMS